MDILTLSYIAKGIISAILHERQQDLYLLQIESKRHVFTNASKVDNPYASRFQSYISKVCGHCFHSFMDTKQNSIAYRLKHLEITYFTNSHYLTLSFDATEFSLPETLFQGFSEKPHISTLNNKTTILLKPSQSCCINEIRNIINYCNAAESLEGYRQTAEQGNEDEQYNLGDN